MDATLCIVYGRTLMIIIKLRFIGISQADRAGLEKAPRWAKIWSKVSNTRHAWTLLYLDFVLYIYINSYMIKIKEKQVGIKVPKFSADAFLWGLFLTEHG